MAHRSVVSWSSMIGGHAQAEDTGGACALFGEMRRQGFLEDEFTSATVYRQVFRHLHSTFKIA
ncbi:hypothetical protein U9M48_015126 [Paspalum notatum var. saurae]|uniref:Pentatricopeptide repeat-containing protein n=1 Tax=Paspalum notatum var. saurae TaxID=547442 RepID=A0AAQ3T4L5_PASNO